MRPKLTSARRRETMNEINSLFKINQSRLTAHIVHAQRPIWVNPSVHGMNENERFCAAAKNFRCRLCLFRSGFEAVLGGFVSVSMGS
jgi:hypothetical protein